jgi:hypothetical protein
MGVLVLKWSVYQVGTLARNMHELRYLCGTTLSHQHRFRLHQEPLQHIPSPFWTVRFVQACVAVFGGLIGQSTQMELQQVTWLICSSAISRSDRCRMGPNGPVTFIVDLIEHQV